MNLYDMIMADMKEAMKNHDKELLSTIRMLKSEIDLYKINNNLDRSSSSDEIVINVASKQVKTHRQSIEEFKQAGRDDLAENLEKEINVIMKYLPEQLSEEEINKIIDEIFLIVKPTSKKDMGAIMKEANSKLKGRADMKYVSSVIQSKLN